MKYRYIECFSPAISLTIEVQLDAIVKMLASPERSNEQNLQKALEYLASKGAEAYSDISLNQFQDTLGVSSLPLDFTLQKVCAHSQLLNELFEDMSPSLTDDEKRQKASVIISDVLVSLSHIASALDINLSSICEGKKNLDI